MEITLNASDTALLLEILHEHQQQLLRQIAKTEHLEFKEVLMRKEKALESMFSKLKDLKPADVTLRSAPVEC